MSSRRPVRIDVVGLGKVAREVHLPLLRELVEFDVVVIADPEAAVLEKASNTVRKSVVQTVDPSAVCRGEAAEIDAVLIASPTRFHAEQVEAALRAGLHVYVEKPLAARLEEAAALSRIPLERAQVVQLGFNYRFDPAYVEIARRIRDGSVGRVRCMSMAFRAPIDPRATWRQDERSGGGVLLDLFSHDVDLLGMIGFRFVEVAAMEEGEAIRLRGSLRRGSTGDLSETMEQIVSFEGDYAYRSPDRVECRVRTESGVLGYDRYRDLRPTWSPAGPKSIVATAQNVARHVRALGEAVERRRSPWRQPTFRRALRAFADAARQRSPSGPVTGASLSDGLQSLRVVEAARRSSREGGRTVTLELDQVPRT